MNPVARALFQQQIMGLTSDETRRTLKEFLPLLAPEVLGALGEEVDLEIVRRQHVEHGNGHL